MPSQEEIQWAMKKSTWKDKIKALEPMQKPASAKVGLMKMCEAYGHPEYFTPIYNQMIDKLFGSAENRYTKHTFFALGESDIYFDKIGVMVWGNLLESYFSEEWLDAVVDVLFFWDDQARKDYEIQCILQRSRSRELRSWLSKNYEEDSDFMQIAIERGLDKERRSKAIDEFKKAISKELKRRQKPKAVLQWIYKIVKDCPDGMYM